MSTEAIIQPQDLTSEPSSVSDRDQSGFTARLEGDAVVACAGELDVATNSHLRRSLNRVLRLAPDRVVVDLSRVSFFGAGAIGELVRARTKSRARGGDLVVRAPSPVGRRLLSIFGLTDFIVGDPAKATASSEATGDVGAHRDELVAAWEAACATDRYGAAPLVFDPTTMVSQLLALLDDPSSVTAAAGPAGALARRDETSAATAVMQLWALSDVVHARPRTNETGSEHEDRRRLRLQAALAAMAGAALAELEQTTLNPAVEIAGRFSAGNRSSVVIDEAKGLIAEHFDIGIGEASNMLRAFSTAEGQSMQAAAGALMARAVDVARLAPHRLGQSTASRDGTDQRAPSARS